MQFRSKPVEEHLEVPLADDGQFERVVERWRAREPASSPGDQPDALAASTPRCHVVSVGEWADPAQDPAAQAQLAEIVALLGALEREVVGAELYRRARPDPRTYLGKGAAEAIGERAREAGATMLIVDAMLSPSQTRNLEDVTGLSVGDREGVILEVFARHARTRRARIQVEIAQLEYLRPRIRGIGLSMDQQAGGLANARGPGETASELLARQLDGRLVELRREYGRLERSGARQRQARAECGRVALVGYTNAGKTSLMNALTRAELSARDMPFETLDTTTRALTRHGGDVVISDTVGFIRRLPKRLLASFETTLAEIREATLLAIVVDLSDPEWAMHLETTQGVLARLDAAELPRMYVFNKLDRLAQAPDELELRARCGEHGYAVLSSRDAGAVAALRERLIAGARPDHRRARVLLRYEHGELISRAYAGCKVHDSVAREHGLELELEGPAQLVAQLEREGEEVQR